MQKWLGLSQIARSSIVVNGSSSSLLTVQSKDLSQRHVGPLLLEAQDQGKLHYVARQYGLEREVWGGSNARCGGEFQHTTFVRYFFFCSCFFHSPFFLKKINNCKYIMQHFSFQAHKATSLSVSDFVRSLVSQILGKCNDVTTSPTTGEVKSPTLSCRSLSQQYAEKVIFV